MNVIRAQTGVKETVREEGQTDFESTLPEPQKVLRPEELQEMPLSVNKLAPPCVAQSTQDEDQAAKVIPAPPLSQLPGIVIGVTPNTGNAYNINAINKIKQAVRAMFISNLENDPQNRAPFFTVVAVRTSHFSALPRHFLLSSINSGARQEMESGYAEQIPNLLREFYTTQAQGKLDRKALEAKVQERMSRTYKAPFMESKVLVTADTKDLNFQTFNFEMIDDPTAETPIPVPCPRRNISLKKKPGLCDLQRPGFLFGRYFFISSPADIHCLAISSPAGS